MGLDASSSIPPFVTWAVFPLLKSIFHLFAAALAVMGFIPSMIERIKAVHVIRLVTRRTFSPQNFFII